MAFETIADAARRRDMWRHYWARDRQQRPLVVNTVTRPGASVPPGDGYASPMQGRFESIVARTEATLAATEYLGEALPYASADHGPDQFAALLGTDLEYKPESPDTNWAHPVVEDWDAFLPLSFDQSSRICRSITELSRLLAAASRGRWAVSVADLHSNMDALAALRGPQNLCMDLMMCPEKVEEAMRQVRRYTRCYIRPGAWPAPAPSVGHRSTVKAAWRRSSVISSAW